MAPSGYGAPIQILPKRGQNPLPYFKEHAYKFGENAVYGVMLASIPSGLALAHAEAKGWAHLTGVAVATSGSIALAQCIGAQLARSKSERSLDGVTLFLAIKWLLIGGIFGLPVLFKALGISLSTATTAFVGAGVGAVLQMVVWYLGFKYIYRPNKFPRWWIRLTLQGFAFIGAIAALAIVHL